MSLSKMNLESATIVYTSEAYNFSIYYLKKDDKHNGLLFTVGLSEIDQLDYSKEAINVYSKIELYFHLPSYWRLEQENQSWPLSILIRIAEVPIKNKTWFGPGDTLPFDKMTPPSNINKEFKQNYFILTNPLKIKEELDSISTQVNFLGIMPIFDQEFHYKNSHSAYKFLEKIKSKGFSELIDQYRQPVAKKRFFGLF